MAFSLTVELINIKIKKRKETGTIHLNKKMSEND
jgi:hypothetical protein